MQVNYLILAHQNFDQLDSLIESLETNKTFFYIHIDKDVSLSGIRNYSFFSNKKVTVIKKRLSVNWGGFSMVAATLNLMKTAISNKTPGYFILLSGQDHPIKSNTYIYNFLLENYGAEFLNYWTLPFDDWTEGGFYRLHYYWFVDSLGYEKSAMLCTFQEQSKFKRTFFKDLPVYGSSQWWCLTFECVDYILKFIKHNPEYVEYFKFTLIPDELFFSTILLNSGFVDDIVNDNLKHIVFKQYSAHPNILTSADLISLKNPSKLWARKFDFKEHPFLLKEIESYRKLDDTNV